MSSLAVTYGIEKYVLWMGTIYTFIPSLSVSSHRQRQGVNIHIMYLVVVDRVLLYVDDKDSIHIIVC